MRLLIIMKKSSDQSLAAERNARYLQMVEIYKNAGFKAFFSYAENIDGIRQTRTVPRIEKR